MSETDTQVEWRRRKADVIRLSLPPEAAQQEREESARERREFLKSLAGWVFMKAPRQPAEVRIALAQPLFRRTSALVMAHGGATLLAAAAFFTSSQSWPAWFLATNLLFWVARIVHFRVAARLRLRLGPPAVLVSLRTYVAIGIAWSALNGMFLVFTLTDNTDPGLKDLAFPFVLGLCSGIAARCAGVPGYALAQISLLMLPQAVRNLFLGTWNVLLALAILGYVMALVSIVHRLHADLLRMICVQRRSFALAARFDAALSNMLQGLVLYDSEGTLRVINRRFFRMFGLAPGSLVEGDHATDVARACASAGLIQGSSASLHAGRGAGHSGVLELEDGRSIAVTSEAMPDGGIIASYEDITERRANEARIAHMALHDGLTNMPNRLLFHDRLNQSVARLGRGEGFAIACLDLDHFKAVNDTLGHNMGDRLLQEVASRLRCCLREVDLVARLGGDEFAVLLPGVHDSAEAQLVARRLIDTVSGVYEINGATMTIGVSIGLALAPRDGITAEALLMHADLAMYAAKADGRGGVRLFESDLSFRIAARQELERDFRAALERQEFVIHYQPILSLALGRVITLEALVRWNHPRRGLVGPDQFIPFAEESGLITQLGDWVLDTACRQAAAWPLPVSVAINLSPVQFRNGNLLASVLSALERSGLPPGRLEVEITEAAILRETEATLAALRHLRTLGVRVAFDDFGTGFSSLSYLHRFVFDKIKIDKSFIHDLGTSESAAAIVRAITGLGSNLNLITTAEGVETLSQMAHLRGLGCSEVQGYLFSPARPNAEIPALLVNAPMLAALLEEEDGQGEPALSAA